MHDHDNVLPDSGHTALRVQNPGDCRNLQRQHAQVQAFSDEFPMHDHNNLLPDLGHPAFRVQYPIYGMNLQFQHPRVQDAFRCLLRCVG